MDRLTLDRLLETLDPDPRQAATEYRRLHERIARFVEWNHAEDPDALADQVLDRLGKRLLEPESEIQNVSSFALGIARFLLQEEARRSAKAQEAHRVWSAADRASPAEAELMDEALQACLAQMRPDRRRLIESYYLHDAGKAEGHRQLAQQFGLSINALRNRALRLRKDLESAILAYIGGNG